MNSGCAGNVNFLSFGIRSSFVYSSTNLNLFRQILMIKFELFLKKQLRPLFIVGVQLFT